MFVLKYHNRTDLLTAAVLAVAVSTGGCTQGDDPRPGDGSPEGRDAVRFGVSVGGTRASVADIDVMRESGFGVFASTTGIDDYNPDASEGYTSDFMHNQMVGWKASDADGDDAGTWHYEPVKKWPASKVSFFAYAPYTATSGTTGITGFTGPEIPGAPRLIFVMDPDVDRQIDLLMADTGRTLNLKRGDVEFRFKHMLSRIGFKCGSETVVDGSTTITLNSVTLKSAALSSEAALNLLTGAWENRKTGETAYTLDTTDFVEGSNVITASRGKGVTDLTDGGKYLMIIPSDETVTVGLSVNYDVETLDRNLPEGKIKINNDVTSEFDYNFATGKAYWFTISLGLKSVEIGAAISDWDNLDIDMTTPVEKPKPKNP